MLITVSVYYGKILLQSHIDCSSYIVITFFYIYVEYIYIDEYICFITTKVRTRKLLNLH